ncbi:enterobactin ABC transporter permease [Limoniibacter endophyticus]|uniref:Enterobactin ABC transporter permease n=2 Tax=Limoniibacter endophyticus TaxID=1565040 RepID=A0A8J3DMJ8_9HYPH|nr:enterobactin ABC transporter permease [Limoniibacter endophyticus]
MQPDRASFFSPARILMLLAIGCVLVIALFMTLNARGSWGFILPFRGLKIATMLLVGYAIALSTVLFQTLSNNRILTPSIMGFDALYALLQTALVFQLGAAATSSIDPNVRFLVELVVMVAFSGLLYSWLLGFGNRSLHLLMLVGIVFGILFRSLSALVARIIDPNDFVVLQDRLFASFNKGNTHLLLISALIVLAVSIIIWRNIRVYDVMALGRDTAINLGLNHRRVTLVTLALIAILVSVSTALVGPVTFFGLLVANLAYMAMPTHRHAYTLPAAAMIAAITLVGGQLILERLLAFDTALAVVIEFVGGLFFLFLLVRGYAR